MRNINIGGKTKIQGECKIPISESNFIQDAVFFIKDNLDGDITDPISAKRQNNEQFVITSYPKRLVNYPIITIRTPSMNIIRAGMQTEAIDVPIRIEIRIWARNIRERDQLSQDIINRLKDIQFVASTGSAASGLHNFRVISTVDIDEEGDNTPKSRIINIEYTMYLPS